MIEPNVHLSLVRTPPPVHGAEIARRRAFAILACAPIASLMATGAAAQTAAAPGALQVDVHCHAFNASDLPVSGFVQRVGFGDPESQVVLDRDPRTSKALLPAMAATLIGWLSWAITAKDELAALQGGQRPKAIRDRVSMTPELDDRNARVLFDVINGRAGGDVRKDLPAPPSLPAETTNLFFKALLQEVRMDERTATAHRGQSDLYRGIVKGLADSKGPFGQLWRWSRTLTGSRREILSEAVRLYGGAGGINLFTPALIDFSLWLDDEADSDLESQIRVAEALQRQALGANVHFFAPFDPWRQIRDQRQGRRPTALDLAKWAVREMGFVGVKVYPAMGFRPSGNAGAGLTYPERAKEFPDFPARLDNALEELYAWAEAERVPIVSHTMHSQGAAPGYAERSHPQHWRAVLLRHPRLRVDLVHLGGFLPITPTMPTAWEEAAGDLMLAVPGSVLADIGYLSELIPGAASAERRAEVLHRLGQFRSTFDPQVQRMMYDQQPLRYRRQPPRHAHGQPATPLADGARAGKTRPSAHPRPPAHVRVLCRSLRRIPAHPRPPAWPHPIQHHPTLRTPGRRSRAPTHPDHRGDSRRGTAAKGEASLIRHQAYRHICMALF